MLAEKGPTQAVENTLTIQVGKRTLSYPDREWYRPYKDVANVLRKNPATVGDQLHAVLQNDPSIKVTTVRALKISGRLGELDFEASRQTIVCNRGNFEKLLIAAASKKKPEKPRSDSSFKDVVLPERTLERPRKELKPTKKIEIKYPKQVLAEKSVIKALFHLANGTLQDAAHDIKEFLEQVAMEHVRLARFKDDPNEGILKKILGSDSPTSLKRFFKVNLDATLDNLWNITDVNERTLKEEKETIEICNILKEKGYDRERAAQELLDHFPNPPEQTLDNLIQQDIGTPEQMREIVIVPRATKTEIPVPTASAQPLIIFAPNPQVSLVALPIRENGQPPQYPQGKTVTTDREKADAKAKKEERGRLQRLRQRLQEEILLSASLEILQNNAENKYLPPNIRITLGHYLPPHTSIPGIFGDVPQEELNNRVLEKLRKTLLNNPNRDRILSRVQAILESGTTSSPALEYPEDEDRF